MQVALMSSSKFNFPVEVKENILSNYFNTSRDSVCNEIMELFGFEIVKEGEHTPSYKVTPYIFSEEEIEAIEEILNRTYNYAPNASPLLDCMGWVIRKEFDYYKIRYALSSLYEFWEEPLTPWDFDLEEEDTNWRDGDDWEDELDLDKDIPKHWITKEVLMDIFPELNEELINN